MMASMRDGCQVVDDGIVCYSDRAGKGFVTWAEILGVQVRSGLRATEVGTARRLLV